MQDLQSIFNNYANRKNIKGFILSVTKAILTDMQLLGYFEGFGKLYIKVDEFLYDHRRNKIMLNPERIIDNALDMIRNYEIDEKEIYPFIYAYLTEILLVNFKNIELFKQFGDGIKNLDTNIFKTFNIEMSDLTIDPFIKEDYLDFYQGSYYLYPTIRSYYYFALSKTLKMLRSFEYPDIYEFFKNEFAASLVYAYDEMAPILSLMDFYDLEVYDNNCYKNNKIKKELLDFSKLEFYDDDEYLMEEKMMKYSLEDRFRYGMPLTDEEFSGIRRRFG